PIRERMQTSSDFSRGKKYRNRRKLANKINKFGEEIRWRSYNASTRTIRDLRMDILNIPEDIMNSEQKAALYRCIVKAEPILSVNAPAGTGKTRLIAVFVRYMLDKYPQEIIVCVAQGNGAANNMATSIIRDRQSLGDYNRDDMLLIESRHATGKEKKFGFV